MAKKSFYAEIQRQVKAAQRESEQRQRAAVREHEAAVKEAERARKAEERAAAQAARAKEADRKRLEKEAKAAHVAAKLAEVDELNAGLAETYDAIDGLLEATLDVDDYVNLQDLKREVEHPPFDQTDLETPIARPTELPNPAKPPSGGNERTESAKGVTRSAGSCCSG